MAEDLAVECAVVEDGDDPPVRVGVGALFHAGFTADHVGALQVGLVDGFEAA